MTDIPLNDLRRESEAIGLELQAAVERVLKSGWYVLGPENEALETELADYMGVAHGVTVANGTDALQLALTAVGVTAGSTVMTAANAGGYTSTAVRALGAVPVYADVDPDGLLLTVQCLEEALAHLSSKPAAVVVTHLYGRSADMTAIIAWAERRRIPVVEDCAQSMGAMHDGRRAGSFGAVATTSFYPTKNLGALGDGGAVFTSNSTMATHIRQLRQYGWTAKYRAEIPHGRNSRMDELQAAIVRLKLPMLDRWNDRRRAIHSRYEDATQGGSLLVNRVGPDFVAHLAVMQVEHRGVAASRLAEAGIRTDVHYPIPDHHQVVSAIDRPALPVTERSAGRVLSVPLFPGLTEAEIERVASALEKLS